MTHITLTSQQASKAVLMAYNNDILVNLTIHTGIPVCNPRNGVCIKWCTVDISGPHENEFFEKMKTIQQEDKNIKSFRMALSVLSDAQRIK